MDPGIVLGRARIGLFVGLLGTAGGLALGSSPLAWLGVAVVGLAVAANAVAKVTHFRDLALSPEERTRLAATWVLLAVAVVALIAVAVARRTGTVPVEAFWPLVIVVVALGAAYRYFQSRYLDEGMAADGE